MEVKTDTAGVCAVAAFRTQLHLPFAYCHESAWLAYAMQGSSSSWLREAPILNPPVLCTQGWHHRGNMWRKMRSSRAVHVHHQIVLKKLPGPESNLP